MKILVLNGSPKKKSDTFRMTDAFLKGLNKGGEHEINVIDVIDKDIAPCRGCFCFWQNMDGHCVIKDDQNGILDMYRSADIIIWSFPLYCYGMPSHLKAVLDRTIPLIRMKMVQEADGSVRHEPLADQLLARFEKAGEEYASSLTLSSETTAGLEAPMIPKETYIRIVNGN